MNTIYLIILVIIFIIIINPRLEFFEIPEKNVTSFKDVALNMEMTNTGSLVNNCIDCQEQIEILRRKLKACQDYKYYYFPYAKYNMPYKPTDGTVILQVPPQDLEWKGYNRHQ
jgi:hypothetical protein